MNRPKIFVSGPYRAKTIREIEKNIVAADLAGRALWKMGYAVFVPHLNTGHFDGLAPEDDFLDFDLEMIPHVDAIYMLKNWEKSEGACGERAKARKLGKPDVYSLEEAKELLDKLKGQNELAISG